MIKKQKHRATVNTVTPTVTASGANTKASTLFKNIWVAVEPLRGREYWNGNAEVIERRNLFKTGYSDAVAAIGPGTHEIVYNSVTWDIESVIDPDENHRELHIRTVNRG